RADVDADAVGAVQVGDQRHLLDQVAVAGLGGAQRLAGLLDLGDVDGHAVPADQEAVVAAHLGLDVARPDHPAVDGHHPVGDVVRAALGDRGVVARHYTVHAVRGEFSL